MAVRKEDVVSSASQAQGVLPAIDVPDAHGTIWVPLNKLKDSPKNVRTMPHSKAHIQTLAALIHADRQLSPLVVEPEVTEAGAPTGFYLVTAGKGRRLAQLLRVKQGQIPADHPIWCLLGSAELAREQSLADNTHEKMHPADEFAAIAALIAEGKSIEDVAAYFGVKPVVIERRLKLANVCPDFVALYRSGELSLEQLMAFAVTDDHERQRKVWESLQTFNRSADALRAALTREEVPTDSPLARFVGKAYRAAGGETRKDLFSDEAFIVDIDLLNRLGADKLAKAKSQVEKEGFLWVESKAQVLQSELMAYSRAQTVLREPTEKEAARMLALSEEAQQLETELETLAEDDEDRAQAIDERLDALREEEYAIEQAREEVDPALRGFAGAIVTIGDEGELQIERGLIRAQERKQLKQAEVKETRPVKPAEKPTHSAALMRYLTAHRSLALQAMLAERPDVALVALTHRLLGELFPEFVRADSAVHIGGTRAVLDDHAEDIKAARARIALNERRAAIEARLPQDAQDLFGWLLQQPQPEVLSLLAFCVATTVECVQATEAVSAADELARATGLNMSEWWTPSATNYFSRIPMARIAEVVSEAASPEAAAALRVMKKGAATQLAEQRVAGTGWLPKVLRTVMD